MDLTFHFLIENVMEASAAKPLAVGTKPAVAARAHMRL
jgi:hypothetical protein